MKNAKLLIYLLICLFAYLLIAQPALAQEELEFEITEVEYTLPWPGILPDHFLYPLKMIRDRIWGFLIRDPLKKSQWCLLMADKRLWASELLADKGKFDLAVSTATKAEKYLEQAVLKVYEAKERGMTDQAFLEKLSKACLKHEEILRAIDKEVPEELRAVMAETLKYPQRASQKISDLIP